jgi:hypothetical protein
MRRISALLLLPPLCIAACGSDPQAATTPPAANPQPFSVSTQASSTTQAELGVVTWSTTQTRDGVMVISGMDASKAARVVFATNPTQRLLKDPNGMFWREVDGNKVLSDTPLSAGAQRTLELMKMDLTPSAVAPPSAVNTTSASGGQLHPTDDACSKGGGGLVENCPSLFHGKCNRSRFDDCMEYSGSVAAAVANDSSYACSHCTQGDGPMAYSECAQLGCSFPQEWIGRDDMATHGCYDCAPQWLITKDTLDNCPAWSEVDHTMWKIGNLWTFNLGKDQICLPRIQ